MDCSERESYARGMYSTKDTWQIKEKNPKQGLTDAKDLTLIISGECQYHKPHLEAPDVEASTGVGE